MERTNYYAVERRQNKLHHHHIPGLREIQEGRRKHRQELP